VSDDEVARPRLPDHGCAQGGHHRPARSPLPAPAGARLGAQGGQVLALRRRTPAGLARPRRRALPAGVDLAARGLPPAVRRRGARPAPRREHPVLPVEPRRPPAHRRSAAGGEADLRGARPDRPGLQQLDAPVVRRPRARGGLRARLRAPGRAGRRRLGAVLALPRARPVRRAVRPPLRAGRPAAQPDPALQGHHRRARPHPEPGLRVPRHRPGPGHRDPPGQRPQLRRARLADPRLRPGRGAPAPGSVSTPGPRSGEPPASRWSACSPGATRRTGRT